MEDSNSNYKHGAEDLCLAHISFSWKVHPFPSCSACWLLIGDPFSRECLKVCGCVSDVHSRDWQHIRSPKTTPSLCLFPFPILFPSLSCTFISEEHFLGKSYDSVSTATNSWSISGSDVKEAPRLQLLPGSSSESQTLKNKNNLSMTLVLPSQPTSISETGTELNSVRAVTGDTLGLLAHGSTKIHLTSLLTSSEGMFSDYGQFYLEIILLTLCSPCHLKVFSFSIRHGLRVLGLSGYLTCFLPIESWQLRACSSFLTVSGPYHPSWWFFDQENSLKNIVNFPGISLLQK